MMNSSEKVEAASGGSGDRHSPVVMWMDAADCCAMQDDVNTCHTSNHAAQAEMNHAAATQCDGRGAVPQLSAHPLDINHIACELALARAQLVTHATLYCTLQFYRVAAFASTFESLKHATRRSTCSFKRR